MGLFGKKEKCTICNIFEGSKSFDNGCICKNCMSKAYPFIATLSWKNITEEQIRKAIKATEKNNRLKEVFQPTKKIEKYISFDENNRLWKVDSADVIFSYDDIISYELLEDGESITKGGLGRAVIGGALFGGAGAIIGGVTGQKRTKKEIKEFRLKVITRNEMYPEVYINFLTAGAVKSGGILYNSYKAAAQRIVTEFTVITDSLTEKESNDIVSGADEIVKYKKLCDNGVITQEEFEAKKKQLLGL